MAARDIFVLGNSLGARLIRLLYGIALILITVMVVLGVVRGISLMARPAMPRMAIANPAPQPPVPGVQSQPQQPQQDAQVPHAPGRHSMMRFRRPHPFASLRRRLGPFPRNPMLGGLAVILGTLIRGAIMVMIVRILAELGLAVLAMPRRSEA